MSKAQFEIRKIANGYILRINGQETFCDVPEAICGLTSQWVLDACEQADKPRPDMSAELAKAIAQMDVISKGSTHERALDRMERMVKLERIDDDMERSWTESFKRMMERFK